MRNVGKSESTSSVIATTLPNFLFEGNPLANSQRHPVRARAMRKSASDHTSSGSTERVRATQRKKKNNTSPIANNPQLTLIRGYTEYRSRKRRRTPISRVSEDEKTGGGTARVCIRVYSKVSRRMMGISDLSDTGRRLGLRRAYAAREKESCRVVVALSRRVSSSAHGWPDSKYRIAVWSRSSSSASRIASSGSSTGPYEAYIHACYHLIARLQQPSRESHNTTVSVRVFTLSLSPSLSFFPPQTFFLFIDKERERDAAHIYIPVQRYTIFSFPLSIL